MSNTFMSSPRYFFTSESVSEGHPDKMCDQISDAVLDAILAQDPTARVACESSTTTGLVFVFGEITTSAYVDIDQIVRDTVRDIGYSAGQVRLRLTKPAACSSRSRNSRRISPMAWTRPWKCAARARASISRKPARATRA